jgi:uncharacterized membrane protein
MMKRYIGLVVNVVLLVVTGLLFTRLPAQVPTHWDLHGNVNGTMPRFPGAFMASGIAIALWFLLPALRRIDPRRAGYARFDGTFFIVQNLLAVLLAVIQALTLAILLGMNIDMSRSIVVALGIMSMVLGNYMPRIRSNWWMGIRTPWTLENEEVWRRTHRVGGRTFFAAGVMCVLSALLPIEAAGVISVTAMVAAGLIPAAYSYFAWRSLKESPHA